MRYECVGFLELSTISRGILVTDALLKKASVKIVFSYPVSSGKYLTCFSGEVEDVKSAMATGKKTASESLLDSFVLPAIHPDIIPVIEEKRQAVALEALAVLETSTCASCIVAADVALKTSKIQLLVMRLGKGIGGKGYFVVEGPVGEIESAMAASLRVVQEQIVDRIVIAQATPDLLPLFERFL